MNISWGVFYAFLFAYRSAYSYIAQVVVTRFTTLGDSSAFQGAGAAFFEGGAPGQQLDLVENNRVIATQLTDALGAILHSLVGGNPVFINIGFQAIGFIGIVVTLNALKGRERVLMAILVLFPSFSIWSSVAGKEAIVVFAMGILSAAVIRLFRGERPFGLLFAVCLAIIYLFKDHYLPGILFVLVGLTVMNRVQQKSAIVLGGAVASLVFLFVFRDVIDDLAFSIVPHFSGLGSSREAFWVEQYDVFYRAPLGMFLGFFGPTITEAGRSVFLLVSFLESAALVAFLAIIVLPKLPRMSVATLLLGGMTLFWILFASYPLGILNSGSAVRYRTGYEIFVAAILISLVGPRLASARRSKAPRSTGDAEQAAS